MPKLNAACLNALPNDVRDVRLTAVGQNVTVETDKGNFIIHNGIVMCPQNGSIFNETRN